jgi:hypothetical protein
MKLLKIFLLMLLFSLTLLIFLPKQNLYYLAEQHLKKYDVILSNETLSSNISGLYIKDASLYVQGVNIALLNKISLTFGGVNISSKDIGLVFTSVDINNHSIILNFKPTQTFIRKYKKMILKYFKKDKKGVYKYEYKLF